MGQVPWAPVISKESDGEAGDFRQSLGAGSLSGSVTSSRVGPQLQGRPEAVELN